MGSDTAIWFRRILWGYFPVHWKGAVLLVLGVCTIVPAVAVGFALADRSPIGSGAGFVVAGVLFFTLFFAARRHSI